MNTILDQAHQLPAVKQTDTIHRDIQLQEEIKNLYSERLLDRSGHARRLKVKFEGRPLNIIITSAWQMGFNTFVTTAILCQTAQEAGWLPCSAEVVRALMYHYSGAPYQLIQHQNTSLNIGSEPILSSVGMVMQKISRRKNQYVNALSSDTLSLEQVSGLPNVCHNSESLWVFMLP